MEFGTINCWYYFKNHSLVIHTYRHNMGFPLCSVFPRFVQPKHIHKKVYFSFGILFTSSKNCPSNNVIEQDRGSEYQVKVKIQKCLSLLWLPKHRRDSNLMVFIARGFESLLLWKPQSYSWLVKLSPCSFTAVFAVNHFFPTIFKVLRVREGVSFNVCI